VKRRKTPEVGALYYNDVYHTWIGELLDSDGKHFIVRWFHVKKKEFESPVEVRKADVFKYVNQPHGYLPCSVSEAKKYGWSPMPSLIKELL
jgi:hypothetical protein